jgi:rod shape-determining protein MreC
VKRKRRPIDLFLLIALCAIGLVLGRIQTVKRTDGRVDMVSATVRTLLTPVSRPAGSAATSIHYFLEGLLNARRIAGEHESLQELAHSAALYQETLDNQQREIDRLRKMGSFGEVPGKVRIPAALIGYAPYENRITLSAGENQGVIVGAPVESSDGLVGTVQVVEANRSQALLLSSASLTIGAIDGSRNPAPAGLLRGENSATLTLTFQDPKAPVEIGDRIVTSGFSDRIPRGILIGKVIAVTTDEEFGSRRATVDPAVSIGEVREVQILK